jgi:hypothetical protein
VLADVGGDHLQPVAVARVLGELVVDEVGERAHALRLEPLPDPGEEAVALVDAEVEQQAQRALDQRHLVLPGPVLELAVVERDDDLAQVGGRVAGREEGRGDRARGRAGDVLGAVVALLERRERAREADPLDAAAFEDEIGVGWAGVHAASSGRGVPHRRIELAL